jgi:hypothetical protein
MSRFCTLALWLCTTLGFTLLVCSIVLVPNHLLLADHGEPHEEGIRCTWFCQCIGVGAVCAPIDGFCNVVCWCIDLGGGPFCW